MYGFAALFFVANTFGVLRKKDPDTTIDIFTAVGNGILLICWILPPHQLNGLA
jgi:hypothetical protein